MRRTAAIAVNPHGVIGVSWFEQIKGQRPACQRVMFAASSDGGDTFTAAVPVSEPFCVDSPGNGGAATRWPGGGEYSGLAAAPDGKFHVLWPDARSGIYQLRHAVVDAKPEPQLTIKPEKP